MMYNFADGATYELLCKDGTRAPIESYETCHLAKVPAHAVVSRNKPELADFIHNKLTSVLASVQVRHSWPTQKNMLIAADMTDRIRV